jgi:hypothetical protein
MTEKKIPILPGRKAIVTRTGVGLAAAKYAYDELATGRKLKDVGDDFGTRDLGKVWLAATVWRVELGELTRLGGATKEDPIGNVDRISLRDLREAGAEKGSTELASWGTISAMSGITEAMLRKAFRGIDLTEGTIYGELVGRSNSISVRKAKAVFAEKKAEAEKAEKAETEA